jgi:hypothetical protein
MIIPSQLLHLSFTLLFHTKPCKRIKNHFSRKKRAFPEKGLKIQRICLKKGNSLEQMLQVVKNPGPEDPALGSPQRGPYLANTISGTKTHRHRVFPIE